MRLPVRAVAVSVIALLSRAAGGAEAFRPHLVIQFGGEVGRAGESVTVDIASLDGAGKPVDAPVAVDVDVGKASTPQRIATGVYRSTLSIPPQLPATRSLLLLARAGALSTDASLRLVPGPAATVHLDGPPSCSEDAETCRIDVTADDAYGNPAAEVPDATAELGRVSAAGSVEPGHWVIIYHAPRVDREKVDKITVGIGKQRAVHSFKLVPSSTRLGFAPLVGVVRQDGRTGFTAGGQVLGQRALAEGWLVGAGVEGSWWSVSYSAEKTDTSQLAVGLFVQAERPLVGRTVATLSLGGGAARMSATNHVPGQPGVSDAGWVPTARGAAALGYRFPVGMPFLEVRSAWVGNAHLVTDPVGTSKARWPLFLQLGYRLDVR